MESKKATKSEKEKVHKGMLRAETSFIQGNVDWIKLYSGIRRNSDWLKEIRTKHGNAVAYWDSRAPTFNHGADYYDRISKELVSIINAPFTLLEVGAGSGNFTLPLSGHAKAVFAVEPAPKMVDLLKEKLDAQKIGNVKVWYSTWEDVTVSGKYDVALFSHSIYFMDDIHSAIKKAKIHSDKVAILSMVFDPNDIFSQVSKIVTGKEYNYMPDYTVISGVCRQIGLVPEVKVIGTDTIYQNYEQLYSKLTNHLEADAVSKNKEKIEERINSHKQISVLPDEKWLVKNRFRTAIITMSES